MIKPKKEYSTKELDTYKQVIEIIDTIKTYKQEIKKAWAQINKIPTPTFLQINEDWRDALLSYCQTFYHKFGNKKYTTPEEWEARDKEQIEKKITTYVKTITELTGKKIKEIREKVIIKRGLGNILIDQEEPYNLKELITEKKEIAKVLQHKRPSTEKTVMKNNKIIIKTINTERADYVTRKRNKIFENCIAYQEIGILTVEEFMDATRPLFWELSDKTLTEYLTDKILARLE